MSLRIGKRRESVGRGSSPLESANRTPLGFFVLVVCVVELVLGTAAATLSTQRIPIIVSMVALLALIVVVVAAMAVWRPQSLYGVAPQVVDLRRSIKSLFVLYKHALAVGLGCEQRFRLNFLTYDQKNNCLRMYVQDDVYPDQHFEVDVDDGITRNVIVCRSLRENRLIVQNLDEEHHTSYSKSAIPANLASVMATPIHDEDDKPIGVVSLDSEQHIDQLPVSGSKMESLFLHLTGVIEDVVKDGHIRGL